ncbi:MAG: hypothetical protein SGILL_007198 [Bacillariaceae sp.]
MVVDMYAYHRGREGMEARDRESGELLCASVITDTNHDQDAPKAKLSVSIRFPLDGDDEEESAGKRAMYKDVIGWDLSDPSTPSPLAFATSIASEFGLSFRATMDLAASIEQQIETHLAGQIQYGEPVALKDPSGQSEKSRLPGPIVRTNLYGQPVETTTGDIPAWHLIRRVLVLATHTTEEGAALNLEEERPTEMIRATMKELKMFML